MPNSKKYLIPTGKCEIHNLEKILLSLSPAFINYKFKSRFAERNLFAM